MLKDPPCFAPLVGCSGDEYVHQSSSFSSLASRSSSSVSSSLPYSSTSSATTVSEFSSSVATAARPAAYDTKPEDFKSQEVYVVNENEGLGKEKGKGKGYKPYPPPRAGAISDYFSQTTASSLLTPVSPTHSQADTLSTAGSLLLIGVVVAALIGAIFFGSRARRIFVTIK